LSASPAGRLLRQPATDSWPGDFAPGTASLERQTKRDLYICHLFIDQELSISDIVCALNEIRWRVILVLLEKVSSRIAASGRGRALIVLNSKNPATLSLEVSWVKLSLPKNSVGIATVEVVGQ
jgi:hypothetical protein